jgi:hypothetical protein
MRLFLALLTVTISLCCAATADAQSGTPSIKIMTFSAWKSQQITEADNRIVRVGNQITLLRGQPGDNQNDINKLNIEYRVSQNAAQVVRDLTIEDYFNVYLSQFMRDPSNIEAAARSLTPDQVTALLKVYLNSRNAGDQASNL